MPVKTQATIEDLYSIPENGKAEIVNGELCIMSPTGGKLSRVSGKIYVRLDEYERRTGQGCAFPNNAGFLVDLPNRQSFSPDAAFHTTDTVDENFVEGAPIFAVEVRSKNDYGDAAEQAITEKIADYFAAGAQVVWDVDPLREKVVRVYRAGDPDNPTVYRRHETAEAAPALPGWTMPVDEMFS